MNLSALYTALSIVSVTGIGGYWFATEVPSKDDMKVAESKIEAQDAKTNYLYDIQMVRQVKEINRLEAKPNKTADDLDQLRYLREQLKEQQKMRSVK